jgi:DNA-3-methyladenine glycosylase I
MIVGVDGKRRCFGGEPGKEFFTRYHDEQWGRPLHNDNGLFEMLVLEGTQAGLTWQMVLKRRPAYRKAFYSFDPKKVARMSDAELEELMENPDLIRNRLKIYAARQNARAFVDIQKEFGSFDAYLWHYVDGKPIRHARDTMADIPASTPLSIALSKDLKKRGMTFIGPTTAYAYMQAVGLVNDHLADCWLSQ